MKCIHCNTNGGTIVNGAHYLCAARAKRGTPIISIGNKCEACKGTGYSRLGVCHEINPPSSVFDKIVSFCPHCVGGIVKES